MRRACRLLLPIFGLIAVLASVCVAQATPISATAPENSAAATEIRLGSSTVVLAGPWKFAPGDSPWVNGNFLWASPTFDDKAWANMDLHARPGEIDPTYGNGGYIAGWAARGFPNLAAFAWYRLRIHVSETSGPLWLKMPDHVDDAYQIFANGHFVGQLGQFRSNGVTTYRSRPLVFPLPAADGQGNILLAIRFYLEPMTLAEGTSTWSGGMHQAPVLGLRDPIESIFARAVSAEILQHIVAVAVSFLLLIAAIGAFRLWLLDQPRWMYFWLALAFVLISAEPVVLAVSIFSYALPQDPLAVLQIVIVLGIVCWILFWRDWFGIKRNRWFEWIVFASAAGSILFHSLYIYSQSAMQAVAFMLDLRDAFEIVLTAMIFVVLLQGARKDRIGALLGLVPTLLLVVALFSFDLLSWFSIRTSWFPFGVQVGTDAIAMFLLVLVVGILVARRFLRSQVDQRLERQTVERELEQARELQQHVLIPEPIASSSFTVETAYHPARTVGGDFFQVVPYSDGSLLIVVGDVSGKGIAAAMLVAVLVGAARTRADETCDPAAILRTLNERLLGRAGGHFATCVVAHLRPGGVMTIANAGHLPPYRNGAAIDLPGSLPLGIAPDIEYEVHTIQLEPGDQFTFLTDGVLEARNAAGQLLGFERVAEISSLSPEAIAQSAIAYGQEDDITVVGVHVGKETANLGGSPALQVARA